MMTYTQIHRNGRSLSHKSTNYKNTFVYKSMHAGYVHYTVWMLS